MFGRNLWISKCWNVFVHWNKFQKSEGIASLNTRNCWWRFSLICSPLFRQKHLLINSIDNNIGESISLLDNGNEIHQLYWKCEQKCQKLTRIISRFVHNTQMVYSTELLISIYNILIGNFDTSTWILGNNLILPFDTKSLWGWYLQLFIEFEMGFAYCSSMIPATTLFVSCCTYIGAICDHCSLLIYSTNNSLSPVLDEKNSRKYNQKRLELIEKLFRTVKMHNKLHE